MRWLRDDFSTPPARQADPIVDRVLDSLREHPIALEAVRQSFEARQERRRHHAAEINRLQAEEAAQLAAAQADVEAAAAGLAEALEAVRTAERLAREAENARVRVSLSGTSGLALRRHRTALVDLAESEIDAFVGEMRDLQARDRHLPLSEQRRGGAIEAISGRKTRYAQTNIPSAHARAEAIDRAVQEALALKLEPDQSGAALAIESLRAGLPTVRTETIRVPRRMIEEDGSRPDATAKRVWALSQEEEVAERRAIGAPV